MAERKFVDSRSAAHSNKFSGGAGGEKELEEVASRHSYYRSNLPPAESGGESYGEMPSGNIARIFFQRRTVQELYCHCPEPLNRVRLNYCQARNSILTCLIIMKKQLHLLGFILLAIFSTSLTAQQGNKALVAFRHDPVAGMYNYFRVVSQYTEPVSSNQLTATLDIYDQGKTVLEITNESGRFRITPNHVGELTISVRLPDTTELFKYFVKPPKAVVKYGAYTGRNKGKVNKNVFRAQSGVYARVEGYDICANCKLLSFDIILVRSGEEAMIMKNTGGVFTTTNQSIIANAKSGDLFFFRKILYRCPNAGIDQLAEDMSFEIE